MAEATNTLTKVVNNLIEKRLLDLHVSLPAKIVKYDRTTRKAEVQPLLKKKYSDGTVQELAVIADVPVVLPSSDSFNAFIDLPIKPDDTGTLLFSERSLDTWLVSGGIVDPQDTRKFDLSDAQFIPGLKNYSVNVEDPGNDDDLRIKNNDMIFDLLPDGKLNIDNGQNELITVLSDLIQELIDAKVFTLIGAQPFIASTISKLTEVKSKLDTFKT